MPFTTEEMRSVDYMIDYYNLSKETFVFSEENNDLFRRLFQDKPGSYGGGDNKYSQLDLGGLIMTLFKKNVFFVSSIDKERSISTSTVLGKGFQIMICKNLTNSTIFILQNFHYKIWICSKEHCMVKCLDRKR